MPLALHMCALLLLVDSRACMTPNDQAQPRACEAGEAAGACCWASVSLCAAIRQASVSGKTQSTAASSLPGCGTPVANVARFVAPGAEAAPALQHRGNAPRYLRQAASPVSGSLLVLHAPKTHNQG